MKRTWIVILSLAAVFCLVLSAALITAMARRRQAEELAAALAAKQQALEETVAAFSPSAPDTQAQTEGGRLLLSFGGSVCRCERSGALRVEGDEAVQPLRLTSFEPEALPDELSAALQARQLTWVEGASRRAEVYEADGSVRPALLEAALPELLGELLEGGGHTRTEDAQLRLRYTDGAWVCENAGELSEKLYASLSDPDGTAAALFAGASASLSYVPLHYTIPEDALCGPVPDPAGFGVTDDPAVIEALLQRPEAQRLIGGQELVWNAQLELYPKCTLIRYYLDETILVLVWQEVEAGAVGTFSEIFIADGSQFRRKISGDAIYDAHFETTTEFAADTHAVLASGGDMYYHGRMCGIVFYQRELYRFEPSSCDTCYINSAGDMLFTYRGEITSEEQARAFAEENDVLFSLVFGPVLIDNGVDVTPDRYAWGQILDEYARAALGQLGERHYLLMNINCGTHRYYHYATLRQAADAMVARGCERAYTLDGGQTATTVFNGELINPVQFGWQRWVSDIIYFATAIPND